MITSLIGYSNNAKLAIDERREINIDELPIILTETEKELFESSKKEQIKDLESKQFFSLFSTILKPITIDIGFNVPVNQQMWLAIQQRIAQMLQKYFGYLSISDIKMAFEMLVVGQLDDVISDKNHYQSFSMEYVSRVLNAYCIKRNKAVAKVMAAVPDKEIEISEEEKNALIAETKKRNKEIYNTYKETGVLHFANSIEELLCFQWLEKDGYIEPTNETEDDRKNAMGVIISRIAKGLINRYDGSRILQEGENSKKLDYVAMIMARKRAIKTAFDKKINENKQLNELNQNIN